MDNKPGSLKQWGAFILILGVLGTIGTQFLRTTGEYSDTLNLGLLQFQMMAFQANLVTSLIGAMMMLTGQLIERLGGMAAALAPPPPPAEPAREEVVLTPEEIAEQEAARTWALQKEIETKRKDLIGISIVVFAMIVFIFWASSQQSSSLPAGNDADNALFENLIGNDGDLPARPDAGDSAR